MALMWCSFADGNLPKGRQFLGVAVVEADNITIALTRINFLGINPGGEVVFAPIPPELAPSDEWVNRLLSRKEAEQLSAEMDAHLPGETNDRSH